ncbi:MAG: DUF5683 domain-containing protein [Balneolales bacterium]
MIPLRKLGSIIFLLLLAGNIARAQQITDTTSAPIFRESSTTEQQAMVSQPDSVREPKSVMLRSATIPGWGQLTNKQAWKVPIVYGALVGVAYYGLQLQNNYTDYRAAYYNTHSEDAIYGPTPGHINPNIQPEALRNQRDYYRNRRDFAFLGVLLAYGLNVADAYVYAQFRDFDVSDDLSGSINIKPEMNPARKPFVSLSFSLSIK